MAVWRSLGKEPLPEALVKIKINQALRQMNTLPMALEEEFEISATNDEDSKTVNKLLLFETLMDDGECKTIDYFDESIGVLKNKEKPGRAEFACSLLREVLLALTEPSVLREKVKLGALLLHLSTATQEFDWLYQYYHQVTVWPRYYNNTSAFSRRID